MEDSTITIGSKIADRYEIIDVIGAGGSAKVFLAEDRWLNDRIAIKLIAPWALHHPDVSIDRFHSEVLLARKLGHPNIVRIYDFGKEGEQYFYITMEYVDGGSLVDYLKTIPDNRAGVDVCVSWLLQVASALEYAHKEDVIHRDVKPENILRRKDGTLKISDFGSANSIELPKGITKEGFAVGTPAYMAPEQFQGTRLDERTDVYALGVMAYELVTGFVPFDSDSPSTIMAMHFSSSVPLIEETVKGIPLWYQDFVETCMEKQQKNRFQNMAEVIRFLAGQQVKETTSLSKLKALLDW